MTQDAALTPEPLDWPVWEARFAAFLDEQMPAADGAHDVAHVRRVVANARHLAVQENADLTVVLPAAWLHDCVVVAKNSPDRSRASRMAAGVAADFLMESGYPPAAIPEIAHAIEAHSFSAGIRPETLEAQVVQDADRLDSLGALGIARCFITGGSLGTPFYDPDEPLPVTRTPDDRNNIIDHFYVKLLTLAGSMQTAAGRAAAEERTAVMRTFLDEFGSEVAGLR